MPNTNSPTILQLVPRLNEGGVERGTIDVAEAIVRAGGRALIASAGGRLEKKLAATGAELVKLPMESKNPLTMYRSIDQLKTLIADEGVHVVHARSRAPAWSGYYAATAAGIPFVTTYHGTYNEGPPGKKFYNSVMAKGDPVIAVSDFIAAHIRERHSVPSERIVTIARGVDLDVFSEEAVPPTRLIQLAERWGLDGEDRPIVMLPGRLTRWKGQTVFVEACAKLREEIGPEFLAVLVGGSLDSDFADEVLELAKTKGCDDCVKMVGSCNDMPAAYRLASAVVSASIEPEAFGRVAVEAQAMGRPIIATDHGGARETVKQSITGWLVEPGNPGALAKAINRVLLLPQDERDRIGHNGKEHVMARYQMGDMLRATLDIYERAGGFEFPHVDADV